jgi:predicted YcjX-like family ATPase
VPPAPLSVADEIGIALANLADSATGSFVPTLRLGVTGLSRAGKTVFITALVHNLLTGGRLPAFGPVAEGRLLGGSLSEYPDRSMPRFAYEQHLASLLSSPPSWPESTRRISQLRITLRYRSTRWRAALGGGPATLHLDIVDYPGEWLLDLPLLGQSYRQWSAATLERAGRTTSPQAEAFRAALGATDPQAKATDAAAEELARAFTHYLRHSREDGQALSTLAPGRFLMPGDLEGSPALTFAPLPAPEGTVSGQSLFAMLERRYEAYKSLVVRPFFRDHFARLDRQVVLVDALRALNAGPVAVADLETALSEILACFRQGEANPLLRPFSRHIDRILFAATKADHLHHSSHDRLEQIVNRLVGNAARRARFAGTRTASMAIAALRATREGSYSEAGETLPTIIGTPMPGETLDGTTYDGKTEIALFPGDLPEDPDSLFEAGTTPGLRFLRFLPPANLQRNGDGSPVLPQIRFDRALDFLLGDRMR